MPDVPAIAVPLWRAFTDLAMARGNNGFGPSPIGWGDIDAYMRVTGTALDPWEAAGICEIDGAFIDEQARLADKAETAKPEGDA